MVNSAYILAAGAAVAPLASAAGNARVVNNCSFSVTAWSVGSAVSPANTINSGGSYSERFTRDPKTGGRAIKITIEPDGLYTGKPQTVFAYNLDGNTIWYDLSDVFGDAFKGHKLVEASKNPDCGVITWKDGVPPAGSQVKTCNADADVTLTLCAK
ncbi:blastomyces yeast-phase-specific protein [Hirsutella rhossiliensis]|uniref:Blastomyces yeast-phase-specific protein n=1 Tax=Hirsutella rhossiliensis TaxID=111463 RepID=A0A9P8MNY0_9HYPO|nr:uncharacterized protein HRG_10429 [Hirsutella rhossiliensis]KAH0958742.1 blastomyces yeast-phase-specific protein [Hirsutella rhossiliensis]